MLSKVVVTQPIHATVLSYLQQHAEVLMNPGPDPYSREELMDNCKDAHGVMVFMIERIDKLFWKTANK